MTFCFKREIPAAILLKIAASIFIAKLPNVINTTPCSPELCMKSSSSSDNLLAGLVVSGPTTNTSGIKPSI